jgi:hypothetical protein
MDKQEIKNYIEELVDAHAFIKGSKLVTDTLVHVLSKDKEAKITSRQEINVVDWVEELIKEGKILEIEYSVPELSFRVKSLYVSAKLSDIRSKATRYNLNLLNFAVV